MAGTTKLTRNATLEDITRRCNVAIATRASIVDEALAHARQGAAYASESEQQISTALAAIIAAKPIFIGSSEYMVNSTRILGELAAELEKDLQDLKAVQSGLAGYEAPANEIFEHMVAFSVETIQSRIRARMNKLGGDFAASMTARPAAPPSHAPMPTRRRSEQPPPREVAVKDCEEGVPMETLLESGLDSLERGGELLESCFYALAASQALIGNATRSLSSLVEKFRQLEGLENGSSAPRINDALESLRLLIQDASHQMDRLVHVSGASERVRTPLLAIMENMGNLLLAGIRAEPSTAAATKEVSARDILQLILKGDMTGLATFDTMASQADRELLTEALFHATRTRELDEASYAVDALKQIALLGAGARTEAGDKLLSLSNSLSVSEAVRAAATAALIDLTTEPGSSQ
jgi:hypothetical protein